MWLKVSSPVKLDHDTLFSFTFLATCGRAEKGGSVKFISKTAKGAQPQVLKENIPELKDIRVFDASYQTG